MESSVLSQFSGSAAFTPLTSAALQLSVWTPSMPPAGRSSGFLSESTGIITGQSKPASSCLHRPQRSIFLPSQWPATSSMPSNTFWGWSDGKTCRGPLAKEPWLWSGSFGPIAARKQTKNTSGEWRRGAWRAPAVSRSTSRFIQYELVTNDEDDGWRHGAIYQKQGMYVINKLHVVPDQVQTIKSTNYTFNKPVKNV